MEKSIVEREINLLDMFWAVCLKWRQIIVWAFIFAVLAGGFSYLKSARTAKVAMEPAEEISLEDIQLEEDSQNDANAYLEYKQMYSNQIMYNDNASLMQLDANGFYREVITYYVDNHFSVEYPLIGKTNNINAIVESYKSELRDEEFVGKLEELTGCSEAESSYVKELIDCDNKYGKLSTKVNDTGILSVSIYSNDEETCKALAELVKESLEGGKATVTQKLGEHDITLIEDNYDYIADLDLLKYQQENVSKLSTYATNLDNMKSKLSDDEISYIEAYEREKILENEEVGEEVTDIPLVTISKKLVIVGFVGGGVLAFFIYALFYLLNSKLRLEDDFEEMYNIKLLGNVVTKSETKKKWFGFVDVLFNKMRHLNKRYFTKEEAVSMVAASIKIGARKLSTSKVYVTGAAVGKQEKFVVEQLKKELKKTDVELILGKPILYDAESLEQSAEVGCVVLIESVGVSLYREVAEEIEICKHQETKVLGAVVVA